MKISAYNSNKIRVLSFLSIILVVFIHSHYTEAYDYQFAEMFQMFTGTFGLSIVAVPLFYFFSGLLFFKNVRIVNDCKLNIKRRTRTLVVPFLIWNVLFVLWYVILALVPSTKGYATEGVLDKLLTGSLLSRMEFFFVSPAAFHLWFIRDLIVFCILSPLVLFMMKRVPILTVILSYIVSCYFLRCGFCYFVVGGCLAYYDSMDMVDQVANKKVTVGCMIIYLLNCTLAALIKPYPLFLMSPEYQQIISFVSILGIWGLYNRIVPQSTSVPAFWEDIMSYTFFIYLFHEPVFNIVKKVGLIVLGVHEWSLILLYYANPFIMCTVAIVVAKVLQRLVPKIYSILVGGR